MRVIIPAAGRGKRLNNVSQNHPKAMINLCGKPLLEIVLENTDFIAPEDTYIVVGYQKEEILSYFSSNYRYVEQKEQLGTGHAVMICKDYFRDYEGTVLVTFGDMPLFRRQSMLEMCRYHESKHASCTLMTAENEMLDEWARIIRTPDGKFEAIVEGKDCDEEQKNVKELFAGVLAFDSKMLFDTLPKINKENVQGEYYLTEVPGIMVKSGMIVETFKTDDSDDLFGVNTPEDIFNCERILLKRNKRFE